MKFKAVKRNVKNVLAGSSSAEILTRKATCQDENEPSTKSKAELARLTYDSVKMLEIMKVVGKRLDDFNHWYHVYKALKLLDYLFCYGSKRVIEIINEWHDKIYCLREYKHYDNSLFDTRCLAIRYVALELLGKLSKWRSRNELLQTQSPNQCEGGSHSSCKSVPIKVIEPETPFSDNHPFSDAFVSVDATGRVRWFTDFFSSDYWTDFSPDFSVDWAELFLSCFTELFADGF